MTGQDRSGIDGSEIGMGEKFSKEGKGRTDRGRKKYKTLNKTEDNRTKVLYLKDLKKPNRVRFLKSKQSSQSISTFRRFEILENHGLHVVHQGRQ